MKQKMIFYGMLLFLITSFSACEKNEEIDLNTSQNKTLESNEFIPDLPLFVTDAEAKEVGINFLNLTSDKLASGIFSEKDIADFLVVKNDVNQPILYVMNFSSNKGFVVLSASTVEKPILAYGYEGIFDLDNIENYAGVYDWVAMKYTKINYLIKQTSLVDLEIAQQWVVLKPDLDSEIASDPSIFSIIEVVPQSYGPFAEPNISGSLDNVNGTASSGINISSIVKEVESSRVVYLKGCAETKLTSSSMTSDSFDLSINSINETYYDCHNWVVVGTRKVRIKYRVRNTRFYAAFDNYLLMNWKLDGDHNGWYDYENWSDSKHANYSGSYLYSQFVINSTTP